MKLVDRWPLKIANRQPGLRYVLFPGQLYYECSCGELVENLDSVLRPPRRAIVQPPRWQFRHGENREAVYTLDCWRGFTIEQEIDMEEWTERVHEYEKRGRQ